MAVSLSLPDVDLLQQRRSRLAQGFPNPWMLWSGVPQSRNFAANTYPFRASSHFLYFGGLSLRGAVLVGRDDRVMLFWDEPDPGATLWHGACPSRGDLAAHMGILYHYPLTDLYIVAEGSATIPAQDCQTRHQQEAILGRSLPPSHQLQGQDRALAEAIVACRLVQDAGAIVHLKTAAAVTVAAHQAGVTYTHQTPSPHPTEAQVRGAMEGVILSAHCSTAYGSIVTSHGEVLHHETYENSLQPGDLVLADVGAETSGGWAADVTRTWPVSGRFSSTQRAIYEVVLGAQEAAIAALMPGVEYRDIHLRACRVLAAGLVDLGILRGSPEDLVEQDIHALFFPHGIGHLLGLDVHDMEDLGDLAGYAPGRSRSDRFGLKFLRLDRPLVSGMLVTIEPGFYQVPSLLEPARSNPHYRDWVNWSELEAFADVRGIRIEDDCLITHTGHDRLTAALPTTASAMEKPD